VIAEREASWLKFTGLKKRWFPKTDDVAFTFFQERCKTAITCIVLLYNFSKIQLMTMNLIHMQFQSAYDS
jgi:hypothetical protein